MDSFRYSEAIYPNYFIPDLHIQNRKQISILTLDNHTPLRFQYIPKFPDNLLFKSRWLLLTFMSFGEQVATDNTEDLQKLKQNGLSTSGLQRWIKSDLETFFISLRTCLDIWDKYTYTMLKSYKITQTYWLPIIW